MIIFNANKLVQMRERSGLTQRELAKRIGVRENGTISSWETGDKMPNLTNLYRLSQFFNCRMEDFFDEGSLPAKTKFGKSVPSKSQVAFDYEKFNKLRKKFGKTQDDLCELIGISEPSVIRRWKRGTLPTSLNLFRLAQLFHLQMINLLKIRQ